MNLFKTKPKGPAEMVRHVKETILAFDKPGLKAKDAEKHAEEISRLFIAMKNVIYGEGGHEPNPEHVSQLLTAMQAEEMLPILISHLARYEFEARKDAAILFNNVLRRQQNSHFVTVDYLMQHTQILTSLVRGYEGGDIALNCGAMLRECIKYEPLARHLLHSDDFFRFFTYVEMANFDVASDAFNTFKDLLTKHKPICAEFLERNYDRVFDAYKRLLESDNYVTKRQSLKLLGELLLDRANFTIMTRYISTADNLKLMMTLLRNKMKSIQFEAFHVFKVFVANPNKTPDVLEILQKNKDKLVQFLTSFRNDNEDEQFNEEKGFLLKQIQML